MRGVKEKNKMADVVILSSDEEIEDERETSSLFQEFLTKVEPFVDRSVVVLLSTKFEERADVVSSSSFRDLLQRKIGVVKNSDAYIHTGEICRLLCGNKKKNPPKPQKCGDATTSAPSAVKIQLLETSKNGDSSEARVTSTAGEFENGNKANSSRDDPMSLPQVEDIDDDIVIVELPRAKDLSGQTLAKPSPSKPTCSTEQLKAKSTNAKRCLSPSKRKKVIRRLEEKMKVVADQIRILNRAELSLDEMESSESTYIKECQLKERFNKIWNKICKLQGKPPNTGRVVEKGIKCPTTGYPVIDEEVCKFMKNRRRFPDIFDLKEVINKTNLEHDLRISTPVLKELAEEVFTNIGNRLQRRRKTDFSNNFGCFLTDGYESDKDPAVHDPDLRKKLEKNHKKNKHALNKVFRKFVHYDRLKYRDGRDGMSPACSADGQSDNGNPSNQGRIRKNADTHSSSSASDSELNESLSQASQTNEHSDNKDKMVLRCTGRNQNIGNCSLSDTSDFESVIDSDQDKFSQETVSSSQQEPLSSATLVSENSSSNPQLISAEDICDSSSFEKSRGLSQPTIGSPKEPTCQSQTAEDNDCLMNGIKESDNQALIMIIDNIDDDSSEALSSSHEVNSNTQCHVNSPLIKGSVTESAESSAVDKLDLMKQSSEIGEKTAAATNGQVLDVEPGTSSSELEVKVSAGIKSGSALKCSINLKPVAFPEGGLNSTKKVGNRKRPGEKDFRIYESPLKMFRKSTLVGLHNEGVSDKQSLRPETDEGVTVNGLLSSSTDQGRNIALEILADDKNLITNRPDKTPTKSLSLKKKYQNKEVSNGMSVTVIVLSDDDSD